MSIELRMSLDEAWLEREMLLRDGIPLAVHAAAVERARALRHAALREAFGRVANALRALARMPLFAGARRTGHGTRHLRAG